MDLKIAKTQAKKASSMLKLIAHKARLMILCNLVAGEKTAGELQQFSQLSQSAFSQHLAILRKQGLIKSRKEGLFVYYSLKDTKIAKILATLHDLYCKN